jgi:hypothetical protein
MGFTLPESNSSIRRAISLFHSCSAEAIYGIVDALKKRTSQPVRPVLRREGPGPSEAVRQLLGSFRYFTAGSKLLPRTTSNRKADNKNIARGSKPWADGTMWIKP